MRWRRKKDSDWEHRPRGYRRGVETDTSDPDPLLAELRREIKPGHPLADIEATRVVARCLSCDSVLFALMDGRFAYVHLTWAKNERPPWPSTEIFETEEEGMEELENHH